MLSSGPGEGRGIAAGERATMDGDINGEGVARESDLMWWIT